MVKKYRTKDQIAHDITTQTKHCNSCGKRKSFDEFGLVKNMKDGRNCVCKQCDREAYREAIVAKGGVPVVHRTEEQLAHDMATQTKHCTVCGQRKSFDEFAKDSGSPDGKNGYCKACAAERNRKRMTENPERYKYMKRVAFIKRKYGVSMEWYAAKLDEQGGKCAICGASENPKGGVRPTENFCVDHDHETGAARGLLCHKCNTAIGSLGDSVVGVQKAIDYLKMYNRG